MSQIAVIGAGAWGTGLAIVLGRKGTHQVRLWAHEPDVCESISVSHVNERFLPGRAIPKTVTATNDLAKTLDAAQIIVSVMPSQHCRALFEKMRPHISPKAQIISATKGLEEGSLERMTEVIREVLQGGTNKAGNKEDVEATPPSSRSLRQGGDFEVNASAPPPSPCTLRGQLGDFAIGALSGPSFAQEVARGDPTAITIASTDADLLRTVQQEFSDATFRVYTNTDVVGVELGGALKNVIAIAAGICDGLGFGHNSVAALITRGLAEMTRLTVACGGRSDTMAGLAGLGDLVLTCTGGLSRNRSVGVALGNGGKLPDIIASMHGMVAEGVFTTTAAVGLAKARNVEMPITEQMHAILHEGRSPKDAIRELMSRTGKSETWS